MKCAASKIYKEQYVEKNVARARDELLTFIAWSSAYTIHDICGFGAERLTRLYFAAKNELDYRSDFLKADNDTDRENIEMTDFAYRQKIEKLGVDLRTIEKKYLCDLGDEFEKTNHSLKEKRRHRGRMEFVENAQIPVETYLHSLLWALHEEFGYAAGRLPEIYDRMIYYFAFYCKAFLMSNEKGDATCKVLSQTLKKKVQKNGFDFALK